MLDIKMRAERKNKVKVLTMFDIGGSMDSFIRISEELFRRSGPNSNTSNIIISITFCTNVCGARIGGVKRMDADLGGDEYLWSRLEGYFCGRCNDEPI